MPPYLVDTKKTREDLASYYHEVSRFDHYVGMVVDELKRQGIFDNTLIVVAADNGRPFPRCKTRLYDSGIKTPWVVSYPKLIKKSSVSQSLLSSIDLSATCLELAGIKKPECIQGKSFLPILKNPKATVRNMVFAEQNWHVYKNHSRLVRIGNFAYIKNSYPNRINLCYESDHYYPAGKELWQAHAAGKTTPQQQQTFAIDALHQIAESVHKRSLVVLFSDMMDNSQGNIDELFGALQHLRHNKHEVLMFHTVDKSKEIDFEFENRPYTFIDLESGQEVKAHPSAVKDTYIKAMGEFETELKMRCAQYQIDFIEADINAGLDKVLLEYLIKRSRML